jgi:Asp-tRNA(Asn)/Glu-tRNA(Gln) amidotransferase A subunit family amidase
MSFTVDFKQHSIGDLHEALSAYRATPEDIARQCIAVHDRTEATAKAWVAFDDAQLLAAARATATPWRWPPDNVSTGWLIF